jgi:hypothetical protein
MVNGRAGIEKADVAAQPIRKLFLAQRARAIKQPTDKGIR